MNVEQEDYADYKKEAMWSGLVGLLFSLPLPGEQLNAGTRTKTEQSGSCVLDTQLNRILFSLKHPFSPYLICLQPWIQDGKLFYERVIVSVSYCVDILILLFSPACVCVFPPPWAVWEETKKIVYRREKN